MGFEEAAIKSIEANRSLRKRGSPYFNRERTAGDPKPSIRAPRLDNKTGKPYKLATEPENDALYPLLGIVALLMILGVVLASVW